MTAQGERCKKDIADTESIVYDRKERRLPMQEDLTAWERNRDSRCRKYCLYKGRTKNPVQETLSV